MNIDCSKSRNCDSYMSGLNECDWDVFTYLNLPCGKYPSGIPVTVTEVFRVQHPRPNNLGGPAVDKENLYLEEFFENTLWNKVVEIGQANMVKNP